MHKRLFIPGPVEVERDVLEKMSMAMIGHRTKEASVLQKDISDKLRKVFNTKEEILLSTSSGSGLMEGAIRCTTVKRAAVFAIGAFGKRWYEMAVANNVLADLYEVPWGEAVKPELVDEVLATGKYDSIFITHNETSTGIMNPVEEISKVIKKYPEVIWSLDCVSSMAGTKIEVDKLGVDVCITSTQKALALPPGMAICSFSQRAVERAEKVTNRGYYLDLLSLYKYIQKKNYQYPSTPSLSHMFAMDYRLNKILEEGLENRYERHIEMAEYVRAWARKYFKIYGDEKYLSNTLTNIENTRNIDVKKLNEELGKRGFQISNGYGKLKDKGFRIAHMGQCTLKDIKELLENINEILDLK
ncbi:alanine--glyoxylate aminotransferase family protein [Clostridium sporogenes]|uniref:pyridoxal-phosphate-dependent aminotransferase family protein n=1 Tax=Clostridium sporogenes TaxID=1509 RepID=UPI001C0FD098|nr:alanine--glyoxylate aminotransferase family protein [Clostridium sporogenes]MBU5299007.1 alanine--glyoxylate aminotransferase family protein [Clostridium sporogenes]